jgi:hypothetical protein
LRHFQHILLNLSSLIICGEEYKSRKSSVCNFRRPVTSSRLGVSILLSILFPDTPMKIMH